MANTPVVVLDDTMTSIANAIRSKTGGSATMTPGQMPAQIASIPSGGSVGIPREVRANGLYAAPSQSFIFSLPSNATNVADGALYYALSNCTALTSVNLSSLTAVSGASAFYYAFNGCTALTSVDISSLATISGDSAFGSAFRNCNSLASVDLSSLATVSAHAAFGNAFMNCTALTSVDISSLATISGDYAFSGAFTNCARLTSLSFPALTSSSFGTSTHQFNGMLTGVTGCTLHFPAAIQSIIEGMSGYPNFGGTNTTVLFDL